MEKEEGELMQVTTPGGISATDTEARSDGEV